ncbi:MAG: RNA polymerase sigma factor [Planctomycetota bacterium]
MKVNPRDDFDPRLVRRAQRGHRGAQAFLVRELQDVWYRNCLAQLRDPDAARDATQDTALRFLTSLAGFRGESQLRTWSLGIALNVCREHRRARGPAGPGLALVGGVDTPPGAPMEHVEQAAWVRRLIDALPERQREAVALRYLENLPLAEVAAVMGCATGTVKATLSQAMARLRREAREQDA